MSFLTVTPAILQTLVGLYASDKALDVYERYRDMMDDNKQRAIQYANEAWNADQPLKDKVSSAYAFLNSIPNYSPDFTVTEQARVTNFSRMRNSKDSVVGRSSKSQLGVRCRTARHIMLPIAARSVELMADSRRHQKAILDTYYQMRSRGIVGAASGGNYSGGVVSSFLSNGQILANIATAYANSANGALAVIGVGLGQILEITTRPEFISVDSQTQTTAPNPQVFGPPV